MKRIVFVISVLLMLIGSTAYASEEKVTDFTVSERNGVSVQDFMISRGIPVKKGFLSVDEALTVKDGNNNEIVTQNKVLSRYDDGSVKWMQIAFLADLSANETQQYYVYKTSKRDWDELSVTNLNGCITVDTGEISLSVDNMGMQKIVKNGYEIFESEGTESVYEPYENEVYKTNGGSVELVENGPVYAQILVKSPYSGGVMRTEHIYTVYKNSGKVGCDYKYISCEGTKTKYDRVTSLYEQYNLKDGFTEFEYRDKSITNANTSDKYLMYSCEWAQAYNNDKNISFTMVAKDVEKFRNYTGRICNGFVNNGSKMIYSPLIYKRGYNWIDGASRTAHVDIFVENGKSLDKEAVLITQKNTPAVVINPDAYYNAGITENNHLSSAAALQAEGAAWFKGRTNGYFRAGYIAEFVDTIGETFGGSDVPLGELGFNLWYGQMLSGNPDLFDVLIEHENEWIDNVIYEGAVAEARGAGRYRVAVESKMNASHCFYNEFSHLYMSYCMTGQEHYKRSMKEMAEFIYNNAMATNLIGFHMTTTMIWGSGVGYIRDMAEIRYAFMIRAMYYSYELFEDEKYLYICNEVAKWVAATQEANGSWAQGYKADGSGHYYESMHQVLFKNYIMLYALRGPAEYYRMTGCETLEKPIIKFGDYLLSEIQNDQWLWDPVADTSITETSEDYSRGNAPMQEIMASEMLELAYDMTGDVKYFEGMCKLLRYYIASMQNSGFSPQRYNYKDYLNGKVGTTSLTGMNTTFLRIDSKLSKLFEENQELAEELGFADLVDIFVKGAAHAEDKISCDYHYIDVTAHIFETDANKWLYVVNHSGYNSENVWEKTIDIRTKCDNYIWSDCENIIDNIYETKASRYYEIFEMAHMKLLPIRVSEFTDTVKITAQQYTDDGIVLDVVGSSGRVELEIHNGDFAVEDNVKYYVSVSGAGNKKTIAVKKDKNGNYTAQNGKLAVNISFNENGASYADIQNHWAKGNIEMLTAMGMLKGTGSNLFVPDGIVTRKEFVLMAMRVMDLQDDEEAITAAVEMGIIDGPENLDEHIRREEMTDICVKVLEQCRSLGELPIEIERHYVCGEISDDYEAVQADLDSITLSDYAPSKSNLLLPYEGMYGSEITWSSSDVSLISSAGVITKPPVGEGKTITLTAIAKRNGAEAKKDFELYVPDVSAVSYTANHPLTSSTIKVNPTSGTFDFTFDAVAHGKDIDCVFGFMDSSGTYSEFANVPMLIRFNTNGKIDAYNKSDYMTEETVEYIPGKTYSFRVSGSCGAKIYNVTVKDEAGNEYIIAKDYEFRATAQTTNKIDMICVDEPAFLAEVVRHDLAIETPLEGGGAVSAAVYFGIEKGDLDISGEDFLSGNADIADNSGKIVNIPKRSTVVEFFKLPDEFNIFDDFGDIDGNYKLSVIKAQIVELVQGDAGYFYPKRNSTRAEAATLIRRLNDLTKVGKLYEK